MRPNQAQRFIIWEQVEENIELMSKITKDLQNATARTYVSPFHAGPNQKKQLTIKQLTAGFKEQSAKSQAIRNKLAYMRVNQQKEERSLEVAKQKFVRLASIRKQSLKERQKMNQIITSFNIEEQCENQSIAREVRTARKTKRQSIQKWLQGLKKTAEAIREQNNCFHSIQIQQKLAQKYKKTKKADKIRKDIQKSRVSVQESQMMYIESSRQRHRRDLQSRYSQLSQRRVNFNVNQSENQKLVGVLKSQTERVNIWHSRKLRQVEQYKSLWVKSKQNPQSFDCEMKNSTICAI